MAEGITTRVEGLVPSAPLRGLLAVATVLDPDADDRWIGGVALDRGPCGCAEVWEPCAAEPEAKAAGDGSDAEPPEFQSFVVYHADSCSTFGLGAPAEFQARLRQTLDATQHRAIEHEFATSTLMPTNPGLSAAEATILDGTTDDLRAATAALERAIADSCRAGVIHATPEAATYMAAHNLIFADGQRLRTVAMGTPVVAGSGYPGAGPEGEDAPEAGTTWLYATGPVRVRLGAVQMLADDLSSSMDRATNLATFRAERPALVEWDRCLHAAQLTTLA